MLTSKQAIEQLEALAADQSLLTEKPLSQGRLAMKRFRGRKSGMIGLSIVMFLVAIAIFAPLIAPYDPDDVLIGEVENITRRAPPCIHALGCAPELPQHILGTDGNTRDQFSRIVYGSRVSLTLGLFTVTLALVVGTSLGAVAGYAGGWLDNVIKHADVVLWSGHPLSNLSTVQQTWIDGRKYFDRTEDRKAQADVRKQRLTLIQKVLASGEEMEKPNVTTIDPAKLWPRHDEFCGHHHHHDDDHSHHHEDE